MTERQIVVDVLLMFLSCESDTFKKVNSSFIISQPIMLVHITPVTLNSVLNQLGAFSNLIEHTKEMITGLSEGAGMVI